MRDDILLTIKDVEDYTGLSAMTILNLVDAGKFPRPMKNNGLWLSMFVQKWMKDYVHSTMDLRCPVDPERLYSKK